MAYDDLPALHAATHAPGAVDQLSTSYATVAGGNSFTGNQTINNRLIALGGSRLGGYATGAAALTLALNTNKYLEVTAAGVTITLPPSTTGYDFYIINTSTGTVTVAGNGTDKIGNTASAANSVSVAAGATLHIVGNGTAWRML